ncbi:MAG: hypothetical protein H6511_07180 [Holophagales bacterium]|nr:hypothetical protein [Holophagales bacterium]
MRRFRGTGPKAVACALAALATCAVALRAEPTPTMLVEELRAGQRGWGVSVFQGSERKRFEVEILGVLRDIQPGSDMILARLTGADLEKTGVIAGMSGSPVWIEDRLVGAVAFSWAFSHEAVAGITPIGAMRAIESSVPWGVGVGGGGGVGGARASLDAIARRELPESLLAESVAGLAGGRRAQGSPALLWAASGFAPRTLERLGASLPSLAAAGASSGSVAGLAGDLQPGDAVAEVWIDGDLRLAATGTVTDRDGDTILAFGHPVTSLGAIELPMAPAEIVTVLSSALSSFKLANVGAPVGSFVRDHAAGAVGRIGRPAATVPMSLRVAGPTPRSFELRLGKVPSLLPTLAAIGTLGVLDVAAPLAGTEGIDLKLRFDLGADGPLELSQSFDGEGASIQSVLYLLAVADFLVRTDLARVDLRAIDVELEPHAEPRTETLTGLHAERTELEPGDLVRLFVDLRRYRGEVERRTVELRLPPDLPSGRYTLLVGDGASADAARLAIEPIQPVRLEQALLLLRSLGSSRSLTVLGVLPGRGIAAGGEVLPRLPGSLRAIWGASGARGAKPLALAVAQFEREPEGAPLAGLLRLDLTVKRPEPMAAGEGSGEGPAAGAGATGAGAAGGRVGSEKSSKKSAGKESR